MKEDIVPHPDAKKQNKPAQKHPEKPHSSPEPPKNPDNNAVDVVKSDNKHEKKVAESKTTSNKHKKDTNHKQNDEIEPEISQPKPQRTDVGLVVAAAIIVCVGLVGLAIYGQVS